jgi:carboxylesterase type B
VAALQPMIFCPEPGLLVSANEGPNKDKQFVPCATEAEFVQGIVERAIKESPQIAATKPKVVAIPLNSFITFLRNEPESRAGQLQVVPSGRMVNLIQQIGRQQSTTPAKPATTPAAKPAAK